METNKPDSTRKSFNVNLKKAPLTSELFLFFGSIVIGVFGSAGFLSMIGALKTQSPTPDRWITICIVGLIVGLFTALIASTSLDKNHDSMLLYLNKTWNTLQAEWNERFGHIRICEEDINETTKELTLFRKLKDDGQIYVRAAFQFAGNCTHIYLPLKGGNVLRDVPFSDFPLPHVGIAHKLIEEAEGIPTTLLEYPEDFLFLTKLSPEALMILVSSDTAENKKKHLRVRLYLPAGKTNDAWTIDYKTLPAELVETPTPPTGSSPNENEEVSSETSDLASPTGPPTVEPGDATPSEETGTLDFPNGTPTEEKSQTGRISLVDESSQTETG